MYLRVGFSFCQLLTTEVCEHPDFMVCFILVVKVSAGVWLSSHMLSISFSVCFFCSFFFCACCYISTVVTSSLYGGILENGAPA